MLSKEREDLQLTLTPQQALHAGAEVEFAFVVRDAATGQSVSELEPYLGAWAHFVLIDERQESFIHAHPLEAGQVETTQAVQAIEHVHTAASLGPPPAEIRVRTSFPRPGLYKLWAQLQRSGQVLTQPFVLQIGAAAPQPKLAAGKIPVDAIKLKVGASGFAPAQLTVAAGRPVKLAVTREQLPNCASRVVFPSLGLTREVPLGRTVVIELPALPAGELRFTCGMGMYKGALVVQ
jgi:hypothetical protein